MALQTSGQITLNDIQGEFGGTNPIEIDEYYRNGGLVPDIPANSNVPTSGQINISDFYGAVNGIPVQVTMCGGGGGGGAGYDDNGQNTPPNGSTGGASFIDDELGNRIVTANGGAGGASGGGASGAQGGGGGASPISGTGAGVGGQPLIQPTFGGDAVAGTNVQNSGMGAGGGGGGGDAGFKGNAFGYAGAGGATAASVNNQTYIMAGIVYCTVGAGGLGAPDPGNSVDRRGGRGGPGYISLSGGLQGNFVAGGVDGSGNNGYEQNGPIAYIVTTNAFFLNITANVQELDVRTTCVNNGWDQNQFVIVTVDTDVFCWSNSTSRGGIRIIGNFPNNIDINLNGYAMGKGGNGGNAPNGTGGAGGPAIEIDSSAGINILLGTHGYILGGGGGGGAGVGAGSGCGGGGGAGGGSGGNGSGNAGGTGGGPGVASINSAGATGGGARPGPGGTGGGGGGGYEWGARQGGAGGGGGRRPPSYSGGNLFRSNVRNNCANPGWNGVNSCYPCASGKGDLTPGEDGLDGGQAGGGGDFGQSGGRGWANGDTPTRTAAIGGGAGGKAVQRNLNTGGSVSVNPLSRVYGAID